MTLEELQQELDKEAMVVIMNDNSLSLEEKKDNKPEILEWLDYVNKLQILTNAEQVATEKAIQELEELEWVYQVLIKDSQRLASVNFAVLERYNQVVSPLGFAISRGEYDMVTDLLKKGAILNCHDISLLPNEFVRIIYDKNNMRAQERLSILVDVVKKCHISLSNICDEQGNNAIHLFFESIQQYKHPSSQSLRLVSLDKLFSICPDWIFRVNNENQSPIALLLHPPKWKKEKNIFCNDHIMMIIFHLLAKMRKILNKPQGDFLSFLCKDMKGYVLVMFLF